MTYGNWAAPDISTGSAGAASASLVAANADRAYLAITNLHTAPVWINIGGAAEPNKGWSLGPGDMIEIVPGVSGTLEWLRAAVFALSEDGAAASLAIASVTRTVAESKEDFLGIRITRSGSGGSSAASAAGGLAGGGDSAVYQGASAAESGDFVNVRASATELTLSELPFHVLFENFVAVHEYDGDNLVKSYLVTDTTHDWTWVPGADKSTGTLTVAGATFGAASTFVVVLRGPKRDVLDVLTDFAGSGTHQSPRDFTAVYNAVNVISITGMAMDPAQDDFRAVVEVLASGSVRMVYTKREWAFTWAAGGAGIGMLSVAGANFQATSTFIVFVEGPERGWLRADAATSAATMTVPVKPLDENGDILKGGEGGVGGGAAFWSTNQDLFTAVYTSPTTLTIAGLPAGTRREQFVKVVHYQDADVAVSYSQSDYAFGWVDATGVLTVTGATFANGAGDSYAVIVEQTPQAYLPSVDANAGFELNPDHMHYLASNPALAEVTNGVDGSGTTYEYQIDPKSFRQLGLQFVLGAGSGVAGAAIVCTIRASWKPGALTADCVDVTPMFGVANINDATAVPVLIDNLGLLSTASLVLVRVVANTGGADDGDWSIYYGQAY